MATYNDYDSIKFLIDTTKKIIDDYGADYIDDSYLDEYI